MSTPLILCGPIVRRVEPASASVFLVLREPKVVTLSILGEGRGVVMTGAHQTIALGDGLHAVTVTARGENALEWGAKYHYDLEFADPGAPQDKRKLQDAGVLVASEDALPLERLVYDGESLPSFVLPPRDLERLCILHGSCRKPHGYGKDALRRADDLLAAGNAGERERAQQLFLTGDQIYADDVDKKLLEQLSKCARAWRGDVVDEHVRHGLAAKNVGDFTSGKGKNHLVSLGEYYAMYVFAWSRVLWSGRPEDDDCLASFYDDLPYVRRALANIATYMIFDDHEVTDDWFLDGKWTQRVLAGGTGLGRKVVRHALLAYTVFQHWGNDPDAFVAPRAPGTKLLAAIDGFRNAGAEKPDEIDRLLGLPQSSEELHAWKPDAIPWGYRWNGPTYEAIVLDTRMRRSFEGDDGKPALMTKDHIRDALSTSSAPRFSLVVSAAPVLGLSRLEDLQKIADAFGLDREFDVECWALSSSQGALLGALLARSPVVVLSGDVHFGLSAQIVKGDPDRCIVNFTSSALQNAPEKWMRKALGLVDGNHGLRTVDAPAKSISGVMPRTNTLEIGDERFEETLLVDAVGEGEEIVFAKREMPIPPGARALAGAPHVHTAATPWTNIGELRIDVAKERIVQVLHYDENGTWRERRDSSTFPFRR